MMKNDEDDSAFVGGGGSGGGAEGDKAQRDWEEGVGGGELFRVWIARGIILPKSTYT